MAARGLLGPSKPWPWTVDRGLVNRGFFPWTWAPMGKHSPRFTNWGVTPGGQLRNDSYRRLLTDLRAASSCQSPDRDSREPSRMSSLADESCVNNNNNSWLRQVRQNAASTEFLIKYYLFPQLSQNKSTSAIFGDQWPVNIPSKLASASSRFAIFNSTNSLKNFNLRAAVQSLLHIILLPSDYL